MGAAGATAGRRNTRSGSEQRGEDAPPRGCVPQRHSIPGKESAACHSDPRASFCTSFCSAGSALLFLSLFPKVKVSVTDGRLRVSWVQTTAGHPGLQVFQAEEPRFLCSPRAIASPGLWATSHSPGISGLVLTESLAPCLTSVSFKSGCFSYLDV